MRVVVAGRAGCFDVLTVPQGRSAGSTCSRTSPGIDYLNYPNATDRYGVVYGLANTATGERVFVKAFVNDPDPALPSVVSRCGRGPTGWSARSTTCTACVFAGHPDLRRILMPDEFAAFPLRKDYPLRGRGERHNFPPMTRAES